MNLTSPPPPRTLDPAKFRDPQRTAKGEARAHVALSALDILWVNTGTLCNIACTGCYIESGPRNDRLAYIAAAEVRAFLDEIAEQGLPTREIGFTGGEPFLNPEFPEMLDEALARSFRVLVLTNAMRPMMRRAGRLAAMDPTARARLTFRVSLDHYTAEGHETLRGARCWAPAIAGLRWLAREGFRVHVAARACWPEDEQGLRRGFARLFAELAIPIDAQDPAALVLFPEMDADRDVPEITEACWNILGKSPDDVMCARARMIVKRKGEDRPKVVACTLLPYDERFELGHTLAEAGGQVALNHPHCARFCVLGGASCSPGPALQRASGDGISPAAGPSGQDS
ncbi:MAG: radical SAM protein [Alphaproteobacteria bacterium]